jgi:hypothetical protein
MKSYFTRDIKISRYNFRLEIYMGLEGHREMTWEIFPSNYKACLYAFSNKKKIENIINEKYIFEPVKGKHNEI